MPYTIKNPPDWLKSLPAGAVKLGVQVFNDTLADSDDEDKARQAAWGAIKNKYEKDDDGTWRAKQDVSLDDIHRMLYEAIEATFGQDAYLNQVYGGYLIYEKEGNYYRLSYSILEGNVQLGDSPVEVERVWVETQARQAERDDQLTMLLRLNQAKDPEGTAWEVTVCEPGFTKNGWYLPEDALEKGTALFTNADVNIYELPGKGATHVDESLFDIKSLLIKHKAGWLDGVQYAAGRGITAILHFVDSYAWLGRNLAAAAKQGAAIYGLSYDTAVRAVKEVIEGKSVMKLLEFLAVDSVDIVSRPAAGGKFNRAVAGAFAHKEEVIMNKQQLWDLITGVRPDLLKDKEFEKIEEAELTEIARMAMTPADPPAGDGTGGTGTGGTGDPGSGDNAPAMATKDDLARFRCEMDLDRALGASDLPEQAQKRIRAALSDTQGVRVFQAQELTDAVQGEKDYLASLTPKPDEGVPASGVRVGIGTFERALMAVDRAFGLRKEDLEMAARMETLDYQPFFTERIGAAGTRMRSVQDLEGYDQVPAFRGIREMYAFFTGDPEVTGFFNRQNLPPDLRSRMDVTSSTFTYVLGNTLGRRLVKEYKEPDYLENLLISVRKPVKDFRTQEAVKIGGFPDLSVVDPEAADYEEIAGITDEEVTYVLAQRGNILSITRKTIINDDISIVNRVVSKLGRAARRTHGQYVWDMYIDNDTCTDGTAVFTSGHGNLGSNALTHAYAWTAWTALAGMTEKDSGKYLGLLDGGVVLNLIGPPAIMNLITRIEKEEFYYSTNDLTDKLPNPLLGLIKGHALSLLSADANDWYMTVPPEVAELVEMGYLNGREEPEFFVADSPQSEQVFVADKIRHKIRHEYAGAPIDYVGSYKAAV